jgi:hypothetical protein
MLGLVNPLPAIDLQGLGFLVVLVGDWLERQLRFVPETAQGFPALPTFEGDFIGKLRRFAGEGHTLPDGVWAEPTFRHPRDFGGPASTSVAQLHHTRVVVAVIASLVLACTLALVLAEWYYNDPESRHGLWLDTPASCLASRPVPMAVFPRLPGGTPAPVMSKAWRDVRSCGPHVGITSALQCERLRPRARWVRVLETALGGRRGIVAAYVRGRWTPDLPSSSASDLRNYTICGMPGGVRCLGGGVIKSCDSVPKEFVYLIIDDSSSVEVVFPDLLGILRQYAVFRHRDEQLLGSLRSRAIKWCKESNLANWHADLAVTGTVSMAMHPSTHEGPASRRVARAIRTSPPPHSLA